MGRSEKSGSPPRRGRAGRAEASPRRVTGRGDAPRGRRDDPSNSERRSGPRLAPRQPRRPEPRINEGVTGAELDRAVHQQLRTLSKENAEGVAQHLVMAAALMEADDLDGALAHAETAVRRAGRVPAAREALGLVAYRSGDFARALTEFRTVRRLSGSHHVLPLMVDCERALGRIERALELAGGPEVGTLDIEERVELAIVVSGIRREQGQLDAAEVALQVPARGLARNQLWAARLAYGRAEVQVARGQEQAARELFAEAAAIDVDGVTDAEARVAELDGTILLMPDEVPDSRHPDLPGEPVS